MNYRVEFSRKTRREARERSGGKCECCGAMLKHGEGEYDHVKTAEEGGEATLANCELLCVLCHRAKTATDIQRIRKADRIRDKSSGAWKPASRAMPGSRNSPWKKTFNNGTIRRLP